jgi:hypothetical protein
MKSAKGRAADVDPLVILEKWASNRVRGNARKRMETARPLPTDFIYLE